ncbi:MAG: hypothetical protein UT55_C0022G0009 [Candidatus Peregrinibacteria bacterium GW2011_GWE2_39_6]|nr:MAG: hypothetical protein UT36_C0006G0026 [Candidatus Peregrinibacteria bacterium GW2011_GWF2_39_17]KKR25991.1 MAG: hypothetical protein UT55_C0022G0009 [Candidatus Peregrinibacteria bacterium GW2011_GWE2_39_6]HCW32811.1 hypothetical protein [Candidatus Peregrinibacteria bacterium]
MPPKKDFSPGQQELIKAFLSLKNNTEVRLFLNDILTPGEIEILVERWNLVKLLRQGKTQREVSAILGIAIATVSRGARQLKYGSRGFALIMKRMGL